MPRYVKKRDTSIESFDSNKIRNALSKSLYGSSKEYSFDTSLYKFNIDLVLNDIMNEIAFAHDTIDIEQIQDIVEKTLMKHEYYAVAKHYILYRQQRHEVRNSLSFLNKLEDIDVPWGPLGYVTFKRTYSRLLDDNDPSKGNEEYQDAIKRVLAACQNQLKVNFTNDELKQAYTYLMNLKFSVAGRFLWQLGTKTIDRLGLMSLQNCAFTLIDHPIKPFLWIFDVLMLGVGVGFNIQRHNIDKIPPVLDTPVKITRLDTKDADFIIPDKREGWVAFLEKVLEAYFYTGKSFTYSTLLVRGAGTPIKGFGGIASGPEDLCKGIDNIQQILSKRKGQKLTSVDCLDIVNIIASVVVAGNVRRAATIAQGDYDDIEYLNAKRWDLGNIPNWRALSNNSVVCSDITKVPECFWEGYKGNGEPYGLVNIDLSKKIGRIKDGNKYPDPEVEGFNPCAEQPLVGKSFADHNDNTNDVKCGRETCCLSEVFLPNLTSFEEAKEVLKIAYRICKHSLLLDCHHQETKNIVHKNMRMGIGMTGYMMATEEQKSWLSPLYEFLRTFDKEYSQKHGISESIKMTTQKPSGTLSLLAGVTPGAHPGIYPYFIRRIRIASSNALIELCKAHNFPMEYQLNFDGTEDRKTMVVSFPCKYPEHTIFAKNMTAIDQLEIVKRLQTEWSDNAVSVTVYYKLEELDAIRQWLKDNYTDNVKSCSFLLHNEHGFKQAPYEEITKEQYEELSAKVIPITKGNINLEEDYSGECANGVCPIK